MPGDLRGYRVKRDFKSTPEPSGAGAKRGGRRRAGPKRGPKPAEGSPRRKPVFVIQKHAASRLHYDLRLEVDGVLKSWAVPKGPSTDPREKRLAVLTEDHPLDYSDFEGVIPHDNYGAGVVLVWDTGRYENIKSIEGRKVPMAECFADGHIEVRLEGVKLRGGYGLIRTKMGGGDKNWLLVKMKDEEADARRNPVSTEPESVLSGRTIEEIAEEAEK
jgi:DNA ligase D-like protein (predicted 3'-phosphoesterase)